MIMIYIDNVNFKVSYYTDMIFYIFIDYPVKYTLTGYCVPGPLLCTANNMTKSQLASLRNFFDINRPSERFTTVIYNKSNNGVCKHIKKYKIIHKNYIHFMSWKLRWIFKVEQLSGSQQIYDLKNPTQINEFIEFVCKVVCELDYFVNFFDEMTDYVLK